MTSTPFFAEKAFTWEIVVYFFLGGLAAGSFLLSVAANYWKEDLKPLAKVGAVVTPVALIVGMIILLLDLGMPLRGIGLFVHFNPSSSLSWGFWFLNIFLLLSVIYALLVIKGQDEKAKKFGYLGVPFALLVAGYTGVLLAQAPGRALWHSPLLPVMFLVGGLTSGLAAVMLISAARGQGETSAKLGRLLAGLLVLEAAMLLVEVVTLLNGGDDAALAVTALLSGEFSFAFWGLTIVLGTVLPAIALFRSKVPAAIQVIASILVLVGVFTMRYVIVTAGQIEAPLL
jgi:polysulfide reductase chain C